MVTTNKQSPKYRALQISFDGLGSQRKSGDWQYKHIYLSVTLTLGQIALTPLWPWSFSKHCQREQNNQPGSLSQIHFRKQDIKKTKKL